MHASCVEQGSETACAHLAHESGEVGEVECLKAKGVCGDDVLFAVIDEQDVFGCRVQGFGGSEVDGWFGLCHEHRVRPCAVVEAGEPWQPGEDAVGDGVADVGEDARADSGVLQTASPLDHGQVEVGPDVDVGGEHRGKPVGVEVDASVGGDGVPIVRSAECAAVVIVTELPIRRVQGLLLEAGDGAELGPRCRVWGIGEDLAEVEQDGVDARRRARRD